MLNLEKLRFKSIGRFLEEQTIEFDSLGKFVQINGQNNNTGGSSGAGKSTVFMALDYLFGFSNRPSTVLKCRYSDEPIFVEGTFKYNGKPLTITRGKKLSIDLDGEVTSGNSNKTEEKLDEILGMPNRELFRKMLHKRQKEGGFFLDMTPKDMNTFLMHSLGLGHFKAKIDIIDKKLEELKEKKIENTNSLVATRSALKATQDAILSMGFPPIKDVDQNTVLDLKHRYEKSAAAWKVLAANQKMEMDLLLSKRPQVSSLFFDRSVLETLEGKNTSLQKQIEEIKSKEKDRQRKATLEFSSLQVKKTQLYNEISLGDKATKEAKEDAEKLKLARIGNCYVCERPWHNKDLEKGLLENLKRLKQEIVKGEEAKQELAEVTRKLESLSLEINPVEQPELVPLISDLQSIASQLSSERQKEKDHQATEMAKNRDEQNTFMVAHAKLKESHALISEQLRGQADIDRRAFEMAVGKLKAYEEARARYEVSLASLKAQEASYSEKLVGYQAYSDQLNKEFEMAEELKRGLKSYLSCSFDEALETISENATRLIRHIPNMANATVQLEGVKETQDGKIKEEVTAVIHMDGEENIPIKSLCGGERTATDLAIDLSVIDLLESKANKGIDLFILDEPFDGLDTVCIEMALDVLKNSNSNKRLIIVDHNPEVKEMVESKITVVRDGSTSKVVQA